jgi:hypothetical protein
MKRTNFRFAAGSNGTGPVPTTNTPNVGRSAGPITRVTLELGGARHADVCGFVSHIEIVTGTVAPPVSAVAVIAPLTPASVPACTHAPDGLMSRP